MEQDFFGLSLKEPVLRDEGKDPGMQCAPFSSEVSALPQFMLFQSHHENRPKNLIFDTQLPSAFQSVSTLDVWDPNHKTAAGVPQRNFNMERQGTSFALPSYGQPVEANGIPLRFHEMRNFPLSTHPVSVAMSNPHLKIPGASTATASIKQQSFARIPMTAPHSGIPMMGSVAGSYALKTSLKPSTNSTQLTIFYGGTVNVYNDISLEKAQAIMFFAGNGDTKSNPAIPVQTPLAAKPEPCSGLSSPVSITSYPSTQSGSGSSHPDDLLVTESKRVLTTPPCSQPEQPPEVVISTSPNLMPAAVPQARKASLARFLEKRKERLMNVAPYSFPRNTQESASESEVGGKPTSASICQFSSKDRSWFPGMKNADSTNLQLS